MVDYVDVINFCIIIIIIINCCTMFLYLHLCLVTSLLLAQCTNSLTYLHSDKTDVLLVMFVQLC